MGSSQQRKIDHDSESYLGAAAHRSKHARRNHRGKRCRDSSSADGFDAIELTKTIPRLKIMSALNAPNGVGANSLM